MTGSSETWVPLTLIQLFFKLGSFIWQYGLPIECLSFFLLANLKILKLPVWKSFFGCLKDIQVNHIPVPIIDAVEVQGTVSLNGCPGHWFEPVTQWGNSPSKAWNTNPPPSPYSRSFLTYDTMWMGLTANPISNFDHTYPSFCHSVLYMYFIYKSYFLKMMNKLLYAFDNIVFH